MTCLVFFSIAKVTLIRQYLEIQKVSENISIFLALKGNQV